MKNAVWLVSCCICIHFFPCAILFIRSTLKRQELQQCSCYLLSLERNGHSEQFYFLSSGMKCGYLNCHFHSWNIQFNWTQSFQGHLDCCLPWAVCDGMLPLSARGWVWREMWWADVVWAACTVFAAGTEFEFHWALVVQVIQFCCKLTTLRLA